MTRRNFARHVGLFGAGIPALTEAAFAQRAALSGRAAADTVWLNANENPDGPPAAALEAARAVLPTTGRYHYQEFGEFYATVARSEGLEANQVLVGEGSSEPLHAAIDAFTSPSRPLIQIEPTYELPGEVARAQGHPVIRVPLTSTYAADVKKMVEEAAKAGGGLIYFCNPNNPTSSITPPEDIAWLISNLPANTVALIDEAYIHFAAKPDGLSAIPYVKQAKNVIVTRTFSKIYGMAGLRVGFACARPEFISKMEPFRDNVISIVGARAAAAALAERGPVLSQRRFRLIETRDGVCDWLRRKGIAFIEPNANFMMIETKRDAKKMQIAMYEQGVAVGRPFPPMTQFMRVSIGTPAEMDKFRQAFEKAYQG